MPDYTTLFDALLHGVSDEIYLVDLAHMQFAYVSDSVIRNTGCELAQLNQHGLQSVLGMNDQAALTLLESQRNHQGFFGIQPEGKPRISHINHDQLQGMLLRSGQSKWLLIIKNNTGYSSNKDASVYLDEFLQALQDSEARVDAIVANAPGLVFQLQFNENNELVFVYLSEGCKPLLGYDIEVLQQNTALFYAMMQPQDQARLMRQFEISARELDYLDWEGQFWIADWHDTKWINLRAVPRVLSNGQIQWAGIMMNITQSKNEKFEIETSRRELAELTAHLNQVKEQERTRIAREIHDDLGGNLTAIKIGLGSMINRLAKGQPVTKEQARNLEAIVDNTFEAVHRISSDLRPNILDLGIVAALEWQAKAFEKQVGIACQFSHTQSEFPVTSDQAIALFRICQESMSNIAKHAQASKVLLSIAIQGNEIEMRIQDNGVGIQSADTLKANSFGLRGMQERVAALHGNFHINQLGEQGTMLVIKLPIETANEML